MSDPFERLRGSTSDVAAPSVDVIRGRARALQRRRYVTVASSAVAVALIAGVGLFVRNGPSNEARSLAQRQTEIAGSTATGPQEAASTLAQSASPAGAKRAAGTGGEAESAPVAKQYGASVAADANAPALELTLAVNKREIERGEDLTLKVCNPNDIEVSRGFRSSQRYDFEVSRGEDLVWRWSSGRAFAQVTGSETWGPHKCKTWTEVWDGMTDEGTPAPPGKYTAVGILTSQPPERTKPVGFCLDACP